jgi:putative transcriptional regulator
LNVACFGAIMARRAARRGVSLLSSDITRLLWMRLLLAAAAMCLPATLLHAALPTAPDISGATSLAGRLLVASPDLHQPEFEHTVILLARHDHGGAFGVVINRPLDARPVAGLLEAFGQDGGGITESVRVFVGGPVSPEIGLVVHSADYRREGTIDIDGSVAISPAANVLRDIGLGKGPRKSIVAFGYAGWGPSQLDDEVARGFWVTVPEDAALVFDDDRAALWAEALARHKSDH